MSETINIPNYYYTNSLDKLHLNRATIDNNLSHIVDLLSITNKHDEVIPFVHLKGVCATILHALKLNPALSDTTRYSVKYEIYSRQIRTKSILSLNEIHSYLSFLDIFFTEYDGEIDLESTLRITPEDTLVIVLTFRINKDINFYYYAFIIMMYRLIFELPFYVKDLCSDKSNILIFNELFFKGWNLTIQNKLDRILIQTLLDCYSRLDNARGPGSLGIGYTFNFNHLPLNTKALSAKIPKNFSFERVLQALKAPECKSIHQTVLSFLS